MVLGGEAGSGGVPVVTNQMQWSSGLCSRREAFAKCIEAHYQEMSNDIDTVRDEGTTKSTRSKAKINRKVASDRTPQKVV